MTPASVVRTSRRQVHVRRQESGFALLVIFLIAAAVAFTMYQELPRAAFESARDKEQLLMDRGNQYKRAIQVFYAVNKRYPAEIKDLENTNDKRFLRRRYIDPMTGQDEWRLIHTNGSFLTDSLVEKPPAQNAANGTPGQGQTPGGGPLGANNLNTAAPSAAPGAPATAPASAINSTDPAALAAAAAGAAAALNPAAQRRPSDRGFPAGPGFPQQPGVNAANPNPSGANPANFDPSDPRTWPPITLAPPAQPGQPQPQGLGQPQPNTQIAAGQPAALGPPFGAAPSPGTASQAFPGQTFPVPPGAVQPQARGIPGQLAGQAGANPQPASLVNPNPLATGLPQNDNPNPPQLGINQDGQLAPLTNQPTPTLQPPQLNTGQPVNGALTANLAASGFNPQQPPTLLAPGAAGGAPSPTNAALQAINNQLFRPNQAPATGPTGSPGIAGVASKFQGPSIKAYRDRTKYQEWEFVYEPTTNQPAASQSGQAGALGQNPQQNQNGPSQNPLSPNAPSQGSGQTPPGAAPANPFTMPNPFTQPNPFSPQAPTPQ